MDLTKGLAKSYGDEDEDDEAAEPSSPGLSAFEDYASYAGIPDEDVPDAYVSFKKAVMACMGDGPGKGKKSGLAVMIGLGKPKD